MSGNPFSGKHAGARAVRLPGRSVSGIVLFAVIVLLPAVVVFFRPAEGWQIRSGSPPPAAGSDPVVARIGSSGVRLSDIDRAARASGFLGPQETLDVRTAFDRGLVADYVGMQLLSRAAEKRGLLHLPDIAYRIGMAQDRILASAYLERRVGKSVTPGEVRRLYEKYAGAMPARAEIKVRQIVVESRAEADAILAGMEDGEGFASVAGAPAAVPEDGGWMTAATMPRDFPEDLLSLPAGSLAGPFRTGYGWHVVEVTQVRTVPAVPFGDVRAGLEEYLRTRAVESVLEELSAKGDVVYFDTRLFSPFRGTPPPDAPEEFPGEDAPQEDLSQ